MVNDTTLAIVAIVAAVGLLGVIVVVEAEAKPFTPVRGCDAGGVAFNASQGRCFSG
jgi:hypothetical protein